MARIELLPRAYSSYKANLHCHTTYSDGNLSPEQVKEQYKANGYSVVAFTDHNVVIDHSALNDKDLLTLVGLEAVSYTHLRSDPPHRNIPPIPFGFPLQKCRYFGKPSPAFSTPPK